ncbi:MAG TPA: response regulator transcription factor [Vicinamibacteria bacterium]|nr:response regulator transcription factor [Vicinamibacteria bacterium]
MRQLLLIEDNEDLAFGLRNNLEIEGYRVEVATNGSTGLAKAQRLAPDLVILDLMLPDKDGFRVLRAMREEALAMPVLILSARGAEADKVRGLRLGADDYVTKPFGVLELLARVEALLRRPQLPGRGSRAGDFAPGFGDVTWDIASRTVRRAGEIVELAPKEFDLLMALVGARGAVVSRNDLLRTVWGYSAEVVSRTVDTHIAELRRKLEDDPSAPRHILTVRKAGYRIASCPTREI